ncbi:unnamed protein product [Owenia fusiformis]|uniref:Uncharacterized protein n=1 Tax=Owenia fusiformis TaxID=6347 RepID=A0A8J1XTT2_OWEFU|nr:unnamed protein product [Owenia fusiformis]
MEQLKHKLFEAISIGELAKVKQILTGCSDCHLAQLLRCRLDDTLCVRRPSNGREFYVQHPTALMVATISWYTDITDYLLTFKTGVNDGHTVEDSTNQPAVFDGVTPLWLAAMSGKYQMLKSMLENEADVNQTTSLGESPLFESCFEGHLNIAKHLVEKGADVNAVNSRNISCLMIAGYADSYDIAKFLVDNDADIHMLDDENRNVLFYTVSGGHLRMLKYFVSLGVQPTLDRQQRDILMEAVQNGFQHIVEYIITAMTESVNINQRDKNGRNVLFYAVESGVLPILEMLLRKVALIETADDGRSLTMVSALKGHGHIARYLLINHHNLGIDVNEKDTKGRNVLFYCVTGGDLNLFTTFLRHGVRVESSTDGITILMQAVAKGQMEFTLYILNNISRIGLDINQQDKDGWNALFYGIAGGHLELFKTVEAHGAVVTSSKDGRSILMQAALKGHMEMVQYLVEHTSQFGLSVNQVDTDGWNVLFYAIQSGNLDVFKYLLSHGATPLPAKNGVTCLIESIDKSKDDFVDYIIDNSEKLGIDLHESDDQGAHCLFYAAATGHIDLAKVLISRGLKANDDKQKRSVLMQSALSGHMDLVNHFLLTDMHLGLDIHQCDVHNKNAVYFAVEGGKVAIVKRLVSEGIKCIPDDMGKTCLMIAAGKHDKQMVNYLLTNAQTLELEINAKDNNGENALFYAMNSGSIDILANLLTAGVELTSNNSGINVFAQCMRQNNHDMIKSIIASNIDLKDAANGKDSKGCTTLYNCVSQSDIDLLLLLGQYYDETTDFDSEGKTILMKACQQTNVQIVQYLLEDMLVDAERTDRDGCNALFYAVQAGNMEAMRFLFGFGASCVSDNQGRTLLMAAAESGNLMITEHLLKYIFKKGKMEMLDNDGRNAVHYAAKQADPFVVSLLQKYGCSIDLRDNSGVRPIMIACQYGNVRVFDEFVLLKCDTVQCDDKNRGLLHHSLTSSTPSKILLDSIIQLPHVTINTQDNNGTTPFMVACLNCDRTHVHIIEVLLKLGANPETQDKKGLYMEVELLIKAHDCHTMACNMEGVSNVLQQARQCNIRLTAAEEYSLMIRLLTGLGRYGEMVYIFDTLKESHQFELLFRKGIEKNDGLKLAILDYLKRFHPDDTETFTMVSLHFTMYREIASMLETTALAQLNSLKHKTLENDTEIHNTLSNCVQYFSDAAESYYKEKCLRHAQHCVKQAKLVALQISLLSSGIRVILLEHAEIQNFLVTHNKFYEALIVAEAYNYKSGWATALYHHVVLGGDFKYLQDFKAYVALNPSLVYEVANSYRKETNKPNNSGVHMKKLLAHCTDVRTMYKIAMDLGYTEIHMELMKAETGAYLKDTLQR